MSVELVPSAGRSASWSKPVFAAGMLQYPSIYSNCPDVAKASADEWRRMLLPIAAEGFRALEIACKWLDITRLDSSRRKEFGDVLAALGLAAVGCVVANRSVADPASRQSNREHIQSVIEAAGSMGIPYVCIGLHTMKPRDRNEPFWFWNKSDHSVEPEQFEETAMALRHLSVVAAANGVQLSLELFPNTLAGSAEKAIRLWQAVDCPSFGLNPDLGNFIRLQSPIVDWEQLAISILPYTNYWHIKNYAYLEHPETGLALTHPASLEAGVVNYRTLILYALHQGFAGPIVIEHYGGDGLAESGNGLRYLNRVLDPLLA